MTSYDEPSAITISEVAFNKVDDLIAEEKTIPKLRVYVVGGGCSGLQYGFEFDKKELQEDDFVIPTKGAIEIVVDAQSLSVLEGAEIDYKADLQGSRFVINNPNAKTTCSCGSSFSV